jgi:hypothetical protein
MSKCWWTERIARSRAGIVVVIRDDHKQRCRSDIIEHAKRGTVECEEHGLGIETEPNIK